MAESIHSSEWEEVGCLLQKQTGLFECEPLPHLGYWDKGQDSHLESKNGGHPDHVSHEFESHVPHPLRNCPFI